MQSKTNIDNIVSFMENHQSNKITRLMTLFMDILVSTYITSIVYIIKSRLNGELNFAPKAPGVKCRLGQTFVLVFIIILDYS